MYKLKQFPTLLVQHLKGQLSNVVLLSSSFLIFLLVKNISDFAYYQYNINAYELALDLYRLAFLISIIALRDGVKSIIGNTLYVVIKNVLINNFIDRYFGYTDWSWNDFLTIAITLIELLIFKNKKYMKTLKKLVAKHWALIGLLATVYVDNAFEILANSGLSDGTIKLIHLSGVIICGYLWNPKPVEKTS